MPDVNLGALTIPIFCAIFGAGWGACYAILVRPLGERLKALETKMAEVNAERDKRLAALEHRVLGPID